MIFLLKIAQVVESSHVKYLWNKTCHSEYKFENYDVMQRIYFRVLHGGNQDVMRYLYIFNHFEILTPVANGPLVLSEVKSKL